MTMEKEYTSSQIKIYEDYKGLSQEKLSEMIKNQEKYLPEVIEIIYDIVADRKDIPEFYKRDLIKEQAKERQQEELQERISLEKELSSENQKRKSDVKIFLTKSENYSDKKLSEIITRYMDYEPSAVEAALIISEKRKIITSDEKENLLRQIEAGFSKKQKQVKRVTKVNKKFHRLELLSGLFFLALGLALHFSGFHLSIFDKPVAFYGIIIIGIGFIIDSLI